MLLKLRNSRTACDQGNRRGPQPLGFQECPPQWLWGYVHLVMWYGDASPAALAHGRHGWGCRGICHFVLGGAPISSSSLGGGGSERGGVEAMRWEGPGGDLA